MTEMRASNLLTDFPSPLRVRCPPCVCTILFTGVLTVWLSDWLFSQGFALLLGHTPIATMVRDIDRAPKGP